jgi:hypothetical protein
LQLEDITARIDRAFGDELPFSRRELGDGDLKTLYRVFGDVGYQHYLQDQVSRQIIRPTRYCWDISARIVWMASPTRWPPRRAAAPCPCIC